MLKRLWSLRFASKKGRENLCDEAVIKSYQRMNSSICGERRTLDGHEVETKCGRVTNAMNGLTFTFRNNRFMITERSNVDFTFKHPTN